VNYLDEKGMSCNRIDLHADHCMKYGLYNVSKDVCVPVFRFCVLQPTAYIVTLKISTTKFLLLALLRVGQIDAVGLKTRKQIPDGRDAF
jgi:hypothetical protein